MPRELKPFKGTCRGETCGAEIWMMPIIKKGKNGATGQGWAPMDPDEDDPPDGPIEWVKARSHYYTCPDVAQFGKRKK